MKRYIAFGVIAIVLIAGVVHFSRTTSSPPVDPRLIEADNDFAFRLYKEIAKADGDKNIFISPIGIALALQMTYNGASGTTKDAMANALGVQSLSLDELNEGNAALLSNLAHPGPKTSLDIANSLWVRRDIPLDKGFVSRCANSYRATVTPLDFGSPLAPARINSWAARRTHGRIRRVVGKLDRLDVLFLMNAVYFKGVWDRKFDKKDTEQQPFYVTEQQSVDVPMMRQKGKFATYMGSSFRAIRLPYRKGRISMYVFLPRRGVSLDEFLRDLNAADWNKWMAGFHRQKLPVGLPKFKIEYERALNEQLKALGMGEAFDSSNTKGFQGMGMRIRGPVWIEKALQKTFVEVDEEGTRAAAITLINMRAMGGPIPFTVDHPFFFVIRDDKTGLILFMGSVVDPTKN